MLFPSDLGENIPENDPVRIVSRIVDGLNIDSLIETYEAFGCPPYHPRMLLKVVFYAYMNNVYSCRRIERAMLRDIYYMWLAGNEHPSFSTINRFRSEHVKDKVNSLFVQVVEYLVEEGVLSLDVQPRAFRSSHLTVPACPQGPDKLPPRKEGCKMISSLY